jgi:2'-5' RNA ligase
VVEGLARLFVAVDLDETTRHLMAATLGSLPLPGKPVAPPNWHITLRFVGLVDEVTQDRLIAALDQADKVEPFEVEFGGLGAFPRPARATVLWRVIQGDGGRLSTLAQSVESACGLSGLDPEDRPFRPHLTLARIRPERNVSELLDVTLAPLRMRVSELCLFQSHLGRGGARYEVLERFAL